MWRILYEFNGFIILKLWFDEVSSDEFILKHMKREFHEV